MYTDEQIRQANAALKLLHGKSGFTYGHELWQVMSHAGKDANAMRSRMVKELGLISREGDNYQITEEGEKAYEMGFKAWLEERERKKSEPILTRNVEEKRPWWKFKKNDMAHDLFVSVISIILSQIISLIVFWLSKLL